ncbi:MAG: polysaccharide biosynthesis tyrosine autokinase [Candidatus Omnitrophica bacterium]|nr:polysaccharide biosynthesis tyrosine autokinase [Candidatus Omnitrophota bacterium]
MITPLKTLQDWQFSDYSRCFKKGKWLILATTLAGWTATDIYMQRIPNEYEAVAKIRIDSTRSNPTQFRESTSFFVDEGNFLATEMKMITSPLVLERVVQDYNLTLFPQFQNAENPSSVLEGMIKAAVVYKTNLIELTATGDDPHLVALVANSVADTYVGLNLEEQQKQATGGVEWLHAEIGKMEEKVVAARLALQEFIEQYGNIDFSEGQQNTTIQNLKDYNDALIGTEKELIDAAPQYLEKHPVVQGLKTRREELRQRIADAEQGILQMRRLSIQYDALKKEVDTLQEVHGVLFTRLNELSVEEGLTTNNVKVVSYAGVPEAPSAPDRRGAAARGGAVGMFLGMALAVATESTRKTVSSQQDFDALFQIPFLGYVPAVPRQILKIHPGRGRLFSDAPAAFTESVRSVRATLEFFLPDRPSAAILVTSALPGEGKSFLAANLSMALCELGKKPLLLDADLRRPSVHRILGTRQMPGLSDYLERGADLEGLFQSIRVTKEAAGKMDILPAGQVEGSPVDLLASEKFVSLLETLKSRYDYVIIDTPPVAPVIDSIVMMRSADAAIFVVRSGRTDREAAVRAKKRLVEVGEAKLLFGILNRHREEQESRYYQYYHYGPRARKKASP